MQFFKPIPDFKCTSDDDIEKNNVAFQLSPKKKIKDYNLFGDSRFFKNEDDG